MRPAARAGDPVEAIDTPALVVDLDALERNIARMAAFSASRGLRLRPHAKTHKCAAIARLQLQAGAVGVCVQKTDEALALADQGVSDLFVSNQVLDPAKLDRLAGLARRVRLALAVDSRLGIERLAEALARQPAPLDVLVEIDVGQGRCGCTPAAAADLALAVQARGLHFVGLQAYHGGAQHRRDPAERAGAIAQAAAAVRSALASLQAAGLKAGLVSGAGTGSFELEAAHGLWNELQPGSYVFMDHDYAANRPGPEAPRFEHALFLRSRVISASAQHAVIDAGHKSHALDSGPPRVWGRALAWANGGDEHGVLRPLPPADATPPDQPGSLPGGLPDIGEAVWLVPGHCDPTVNLHDHLVAVRGGLRDGRVDAVWPVDARGAIR